MSRRLVFLAALAGCTDVPQPYELDHPRVMAVRVEPPAVQAGAHAVVEVLVTDASAGPRVAAADAVEVAGPPGLRVTRDGERWRVDAPSEAELAAARAALGLAADAPVVVALDVTVAADVGPLAAQKTLALGASGANPPAPVIVRDGAPGPGTLTPGPEVELAVADIDDAHDYRWFSSVGDLTGYTRPTVRLAPAPGAAGMLGVVVRDQAGGTAWTLIAAEVAP